MKLSLILFISLVLFTIGASANWTKYCRKYNYEENKKEVYVGNPAKTYPRVHCGNNHVTIIIRNAMRRMKFSLMEVVNIIITITL